MTTEKIGAAQVELGVGTDGVDAGVARAKKAISSIGPEAAKAGKQASDALADTGKAGQAAGDKIDVVTRRTIASIERQTLAIGKSRAEYYAAKAAIDGNSAALSPYIAKLAEAERANQKIGTSFGGLKTIALAALGAVSAGTMVMHTRKILDTADGLNDLSQQLGISIKQVAAYQLAAEQSGTSIETVGKGVKALSTALVENRTALAAAGVTATDADGAMRQIADVFAEMPDGVEKTALATKLFGKAGMDLIPMLNMGSAGLEESAQKSAQYAAVMELLAPQADKFNDTLAELNLSGQVLSVNLVTAMAPALNDIARAMAAAAQDGGLLNAVWVGMGGVADRLINGDDVAKAKKSIAEIRGTIGDLERARENAPGGGALQRWLYGSSAEIDTAIAKEKARLSAARQELERLLNPPKSAAADGKPTEIDIDAWRAKYKKLYAAIRETGGSGAKAHAREIEDAATVAAKSYAQLIKSGQEYTTQLQAEFDGGEKLSKSAQLLADARATLPPGMLAMVEAELSWAQALESTLAIEKQDFEHAKSIVKARTAAADELRRIDEARIDALNKSVASAQADAASQREAYETYGMSAAAVREMTAAKLEAQLAGLDFASSTIEEVTALEAQIKALKEASLWASKTEVLDANKRTAEESAREWERMNQQIGQSLTDEIMRGGKNAGELLEDYFRTLVLRPIIQGVVNLGMSAVGMGPATATTGTNYLGMASNASSAYTLYGTAQGYYGAYQAGAAMGAEQAATAAAYYSSEGYYGTSVAMQAGQYFGATAAVDSSAVAASAAASSTALGGTGQAAGAAAGSGTGSMAALGWIGAAIIAAYLIHSGTQGETRQGQRYAYGPDGLRRTEGPSGGDIGGEQMMGATQQIINKTNDLLNRYSSGTSLTGFQSALESSEKGRGGVYAGGTLSTGATYGESGQGSNYAGTLYEKWSTNSPDSGEAARQYALDMSQSILQALRAADVGGQVGDLLENTIGDVTKDVARFVGDGLGSDANYSEQVTEFVDQIEQLTQQQADTIINVLSAPWSEPVLEQVAKLNLSLSETADYFIAVQQRLPELAQQYNLTAESIGTAFHTALTESASAAEAGAIFADGVMGGIYGAMQSGYEQQITAAMMDGIINPVLIAVATGAQLSDILTDEIISDAVAKIDGMASAYSALMSSPEFTSAMTSLQSATRQAGAAAFVPQQYQPLQQITQQPDTRAAEDAARTAADLARDRRTMEIQIMDLSGDAAGALAAQRALELAGMDASLVPLQQRIHGLEDEQRATELARTQRGLEIQIMELSGDASGALAAQRALELEGMDASLVPLQQRIHGLEDEHRVTELARTQRGLEIQIMELSGDAAGALAASRYLELHGMDASLRPLQQRIYALSDEQRLTESRNAWQERLDVLTGTRTQRQIDLARDLAATTDTATQALIHHVYAIDEQTAGVDRAMDAVQRAIDAERKRLDNTRTTTADSLRQITSIFDAVTAGARTLRGQTARMDAWTLTSARAYIDMAQSLVSAGARPDEQRLAEAIQSLSSDRAENYASIAEFEYAQLVQAGKLDSIATATGAQKTVAQQQLDALDAQLTTLDDQLTTAREQLDALNGIDTSVISVAAAIAALGTAIAGVQTARAAPVTPAPTATPASTATPAPTGRPILAEDATAYANTINQYLTTVPDASLMGVYDAAMGVGATSAQLAAVLRIGGHNVSQTDVLSWAQAQGLPAFASGGDASPGAYLAGERGPELIVSPVATRIFNARDTAGMGGGNSDGLIRELIAEVRRLESRLARIESNTGRSPQIDHERPVRVQVVA